MATRSRNGVFGAIHDVRRSATSSTQCLLASTVHTVSSAPAQVLEYVEALKWPVVVAGALLMQRKPIAILLQRLRLPDEGTASIPGVGTVTWKNEVRRVGKEASKLPTSTTASGAGPGAIEEPQDRRIGVVQARNLTGSATRTLDDLIRQDPTGAIITAWEGLLTALYEAAYKMKATESRSVRTAPEVFALRMGLGQDAVVVIKDLTDLRNSVAHGAYSPDSSDAEDFVLAVEKVIDALPL